MMVLETERTILRPFTEADAADVYDYARDPRVGAAAGWAPHRSVEESREILRTILTVPTAFAVTDRETGRVIGSAGFLDQSGRRPSDELGFSLHPDWWGRGLATEVCRRLVRYGFEDLGLPQIFAVCYAENGRSRRVLEKCGFRFAFDERLTDGTAEERVAIFYCPYRGDWERRRTDGI